MEVKDVDLIGVIREGFFEDIVLKISFKWWGRGNLEDLGEKWFN